MTHKILAREIEVGMVTMWDTEPHELTILAVERGENEVTVDVGDGFHDPWPNDKVILVQWRCSVCGRSWSEDCE